MSKRPSFGSHLEKLTALGARLPKEALKAGQEPGLVTTVPEPRLDSHESILEPTGSDADSVHRERSSERTVSGTDRVRGEQSPARTVSTVDAVPDENNVDAECDEFPKVPPEFTAVPNDLLRGDIHFEDRLDLLVYLVFFTYSYGFQRRTGNVGQLDIQAVTGAGKNTIKRSIDRLVKAGWIKMIEDYERSQISRKWRVFHPKERKPGGDGKTGATGKQKKKGSTAHTAQNGHCSARPLTGSTPTPVAGSTADPFKERFKENSKNSLSPEISNYLATLKPPAKRRSEERAYQELKRAFSEPEIVVCLKHLQQHGMPRTNEPCHSPMAFLSQGIDQVLEATRQAAHKINSSNLGQATATALTDEADAAWLVKESAFERAYPDEKLRTQILTDLTRGVGFQLTPQLARGIAIHRWWNQQPSSLTA